MTVLLHRSVGRHGHNAPEEVRLVEERLLIHAPAMLPVADGQADERTFRAIEAFQRDRLGMPFPTGRFVPNCPTLRILGLSQVPRPRHAVFDQEFWPRPEGTAGALGAADYAAAAGSLDCEPAAIEAVSAVESPGSAWDAQGRPRILFERHYFRDGTGHAWNKTHPDISGPYVKGNHGPEHKQYGRLRRAAVLDEPAALRSASWGAFQIMGANHLACGHATVEAFVDAMLAGVAEHLKAFCGLIRSDGAMHRALKRRDWAGFAYRYNGKKYADNHYDTAMAREYARARAREKKAAEAARARELAQQAIEAVRETLAPFR